MGRRDYDDDRDRDHNRDTTPVHRQRTTPHLREDRSVVPLQEARATGPTSTGVIKRIQKDKGFGFLRDAGGNEFFFHRTECNGEFELLFERTPVTFLPMASAKGPRAHDVRMA